MSLRKSVGWHSQFNNCLKWRLQWRNKDTHSICNLEGYACPKGTKGIKICIHVKQDFNIRIKNYVHVSRSACERIKSNKYWSTSSYTDPQSNYIEVRAPTSRFAEHIDPHTHREHRALIQEVVSSILPKFGILSCFVFSFFFLLSLKLPQWSVLELLFTSCL